MFRYTIIFIHILILSASQYIYADKTDEFPADSSEIILFLDKNHPDTLISERPEELYEKFVYTPKTSVIHIPVDIRIALLEEMLNENFSGLLYEDLEIEEDSLMIRAWKERDFKINYEKNELTYQIPVKIWLKKRFGLGITYTDREIEATIEINMKTTVNFSKRWKLITQTAITGHSWIKKPTMKIGFWDIPITYFVDKIIKEDKEKFLLKIDEAINEFVPLREYAQEIWKTVQDPIDVSMEGYNAWIRTTPKQIYTTPVIGNNGKISTTFGVQCLMQVYMGNMPENYLKDTILPELRMVGKTDENFKINVLADLPFSFIDSVAKNIMAGETFGEGRRKVTIDSIEIYGQNDKLIIGVNVSGYMKGMIYLESVPYFDHSTSSIRVKDVNFKLETKNFMAKVANLFYKRGLKKMIEEQLVFSLKDELTLVKEISRSELFNKEIVENVKLNGFLSDLDVDEIFLAPQGIKVGVTLKGKIRVHVE